jgi:putative oxygen-independent coproporphyrinogen III oxidase
LSAPPAPVTPADRGVYVHFPYCEKKCPYCDFNSHSIPHDDAAYGDAILAELAGRAHELGPGAVRSIFFGGGTPSLWAPAQVGRVIAAVEATFGFTPAPEITLEANPGTVVPDRFRAYVAEGVNRFSIGAQSFTDGELVRLGRIHGAEQAQRAVAAALDTGARVSLDLMYGLPGQTWADVARSVARAVALGPHHISAYTLTIEPDTALGRRTRLGLFKPMEDDDQAGLIHQVTDALGAAGYGRYEISNYAKDGFEAVHNSLYWTGGPYLGLGAGAHSYAPARDLSGAVRRENVKAPEAYLRAALAGDFAPRAQEDLDRWGLVADRLWVGLRPRWGVDVEALAEESGLGAALLGPLLPALEGLAGRGLVTRHGPRWAPTAEGFLFADLVARTLLDAVP